MFVFGIPRTLSGVPEGAVACQASPTGRFISVLCPSSLLLFDGGQHRVLLGGKTRSVDSVECDGENTHLVWSRDEHFVAVLTSGGFVNLYHVGAAPAQLRIAFPTDLRPLQSLGGVTVAPVRKIIIAEDVATCLSSPSKDALIVGLAEPQLLSLAWNGQVLHRKDLQKCLPPFPEIASGVNPPPSYPGVQALVCQPELKLVGILFRGGWAGAMILHDDPDAAPYLKLRPQNSAFWFPCSSVSCLAFNEAHKVASVGFRDGAVQLFDLDLDPSSDGPIVRPLRVLKVRLWGNPQAPVLGPVTTMEWSPDCRSLAVGWQQRGVTLWSINGCQTFSTIRLEDSDIRREFLRHGCRSLVWSRDGFALIIAADSEEKLDDTRSRRSSTIATTISDSSTSGTAVTQPPPPPPALYQLSIARTANQLPPAVEPAGPVRLIIQAADRLFVALPHANLPGGALLHQIYYPTDYLAENWPIQTVSVSQDGMSIAVAGARGIAIHSLITHKWRLFGDRQQEQSIKCIGLAWLEKAVVMAARNPLRPKDPCELLVFPSDHLDRASVLLAEPLRHRPIAIHAARNILFVYSEDRILNVYRLSEQTKPKRSFRLEMVQQTYFAAQGEHPIGIRVLDSPATPSDTLGNARLCLVLRPGGRVSLVDLHTSHESELAARHVEHVFVSPCDPLGDFAWTFDTRGLSVWCPPLLPEKSDSVDFKHVEISDFDAEVYPLGLAPETGVLLGVAQQMSFSPISDIPVLDLQTKVHPYMHYLFRNYLFAQPTDDVAKAAQLVLPVANVFSPLPYFPHSLELLLHEILEEEGSSPTKGKTHGQRLSTVIALIRHFQEYPDVVVHCARKTDVALWNVLFRHVGDPKALFESCLHSRPLETAASYLVIIRNLEGKLVANRFAIRLLEAVLDARKMVLGRDILRFLNALDGAERQQHLDKAPIDAAASPGSARGSSRRGSSKSVWGSLRGAAAPPPPAPTDPDGDDAMQQDDVLYAVEFLLRLHARKILLAGQLDVLMVFSRTFNFVLRPWLAKEKGRMEIKEPLAVALEQLHTQFGVPWPQTLDRTDLLMWFDSWRAAHSAETVEDGPPPDIEQDLEVLLQEMTMAGLHEWGALIATILLKTSVVVSILKQSGTALRTRYRDMLVQHQGCPGYAELLGVLEL